jgi:hypothetical protein
MKRTPFWGVLPDVSGFSDEQTLFFFARMRSVDTIQLAEDPAGLPYN